MHENEESVLNSVGWMPARMGSRVGGVGVRIEFRYCCRVPKAYLIPQNECISITNTKLKTRILI